MRHTVFADFVNKRIVCFAALVCMAVVISSDIFGAATSFFIAAAGTGLMLYLSRKKVVALILSMTILCVSAEASIIMNEVNAIEGAEWEGSYVLKVISYPEVTDGRIKCTAKPMDSYMSEGMDEGDKVFLYVYTDDISSVTCGGIYEISGTLKAPKGNTTPGTFDYKNYLLSENISFSISADGEDVKYIMTEALPLGYDKLLSVRETFEDSLDKYMSETSAGLLKGIMFGSTYMDGQVLENFRSLGVSHILAVSGLHVGIIYGFISFLIRLLKIKSTKLRASASVVGCAVVFLYVALCGFSVSCVRAFFMIVLSSRAENSRDLKGRYDSLSALALAAVINMIINPFVIFGASFILSYLAVFAIVFVNPVIITAMKKWDVLKKAMYNSIGLYVLSLIGISISVQTILTPISVILFGESTLLGVIYNLLMVPVVSLCLIFGFCAFMIPIFAYPILGTSGILLENIAYLAEILTTIDIIRLSSEGVNVFSLCVYYCIIFTFTGYINIKSRTSKIVLSAIIFAGFVISSYKFLPEKDPFVSFLDVGFGDCAVIKTTENECIIIDGGGGFYGGDTASEVILPYLRSEGIREITALIATHSDADHMGGVVGLIGEVPVEVIYANEDGGKMYYELKNKADEFGVPVRSLYSGDSLMYTDCEINVLSPAKYGKYSSLNDRCIVIDVNVGGVRYLFTGDAGKNAEKTILESSDTFSMKYDVLKSAHHGSPFFTDEFRLRLFCDVAVISVGNNGYGLPNEEYIKGLTDVNVEVLRTDEKGLIKIISSETGSYDIISYMGKWRKVYDIK